MGLNNVIDNFNNKITSNFGKRDTGIKGASTDHKGIDISVPLKTEVGSYASGTVTKVAYNSAKGNFIQITHSNGIVTEYEHLYSSEVKVGDSVKLGQTIGLSGSTGISSGPHLHFGVIDNGKYVDPLKIESTPIINGNFLSNMLPSASISSNSEISNLLKNNWLIIIGAIICIAIFTK